MRWGRGAWAAILVLVMAAGAWPGTAQAEAGLQLNPLKYEDTLAGMRVKSGFIDVSNPGDTNVTVVTDVQGFRQADLDGNLAFFSDEQLKAGIKPGLDRFELGPRESLRMAFTVDPSRLPQGGVYAAIFFRTVPAASSTSVSYLAEAANVGTLLMLRNGANGQQVGQVTSLKLSFWQFGRGLTGQIQYRNTNRDTGGIAFAPTLMSRVTPWGRQQPFTGPFVMPQSTRQFTMSRPGSYLGLIPVTVADGPTGRGLTAWVFACTGWYQVGILLVIIAGVLVAVGRRRGWRPSRLRRAKK